MDSVKRFLEYRYYNIGYGKHGKIPHAISVISEDVVDVVAKLNHEQDYNVYIRVNANFHSHEPSRIRDIDITNPDIFVIDIDQKDNIGADIESQLTQFITEQELTNFLLQFSGHGHQLWVRCDPVETVEAFKDNARRLKRFIEDETVLIVDFTPNASRYGRYPGSINYNEPIRQGRVIALETGKTFDIAKCPDIPKKVPRRAKDDTSCGEHTTNRTPSGCMNPPKERADLVDLGFIHSERKRNEVLRILQHPEAEHRDRLWLVGFLKYCGLSRSRTLALIHKYRKWGDYSRSFTRYQIKSVWRSAGRRGRL